MLKENIVKFALTFHKCQSRNWKQNRNEHGSKVNHRVVQPKACDKITETPLELFATSMWCESYFGTDKSIFHLWLYFQSLNFISLCNTFKSSPARRNTNSVEAKENVR